MDYAVAVSYYVHQASNTQVIDHGRGVLAGRAERDLDPRCPQFGDQVKHPRQQIIRGDFVQHRDVVVVLTRHHLRNLFFCRRPPVGSQDDLQ